MKHVSVVQNTQSEWLGQIEDHLEGRGIRFSYHRPFAAGGALPDPMVVGDGLIVVGGGPYGSVGDMWRLPMLDAEIKLTRACFMLGKPIIGIGLGSQILSIGSDGGSTSAPLSCKVGTARRIASGALAGRMPEHFPFVQYGRDRAVPPSYAEVLAVDDAGQAVVYQIGKHAFGFAGHPGLRPAMIEDLVMEFDEAPPDIADTLATIQASAVAMEDALVGIMTGIVELTGWMADE